MNICVLTHTYPRFPGDPVAPFMKDFCDGLVTLGNKIVLLTPYDKQFTNKSTENLSIKLYKYIFPESFHLLGYSRTLIGDQKLKSFVYFLAPLMMLFSFFSLLKIIQKERIDLISAHWIVPNGFVAAVVSKITGIPLVVTVPGSDVYLAKKNKVFLTMMLFAAQQARYITSNSMRYLDELATLNVNKQKFIEIPYGVDVKRLKRKGNKIQARKELGYDEYINIILAIGRLVEKKGFEYLIKSLPYVLKNHKNTKLIIIGDGSDKNKLVELSQKLDVESATDFKGKINHNDLSKFYEAADLYVAPSIRDPKGNFESHIVALFEAIAAGLPVISTKLGVSNKYVIDGKNGYRVDEKDEKGLASAINSVLDSGEKNAMGKESEKIAREELSHNVSAKKYNDLFESVIKGYLRK